MQFLLGQPEMADPPLLSVRDLTVAFDTRRGPFEAVRGVSFDVQPGKTLGVVGESGSGKSVTAMALMRLLPDAAEITAGTVHFAGRDLGGLSERDMQSVRGREIAMVFQDPMASLNPILTIGHQVTRSLRLQLGLSRAAAKTRAEELLALRPHPFAAGQPVDAYPHQLSGGMRQRVMIAIALSCEPAAADRRRADHGARRHDPGADPRAAARLQQRAGTGGAADHPRPRRGRRMRRSTWWSCMPAESSSARRSRRCSTQPRHPYTRGLLALDAAARREYRERLLPAIPGMPPSRWRPAAQAARSIRAALTLGSACRVRVVRRSPRLARRPRCRLPAS